MHVHDIAPFGDVAIDFRHTIHKLSFGQTFPGMRNPLDGAQAGYTKQPASGMFQYFLKVGGKERPSSGLDCVRTRGLAYMAAWGALRDLRSCRSFPTTTSVVRRPMPTMCHPPSCSCPQPQPQPHTPQVVPTSYTELSNRTMATNQFSVTENFREAQVGGGVVGRGGG